MYRTVPVMLAVLASRLLLAGTAEAQPPLAPTSAAAVRIAQLPVPGPPALVAIARDVVDVVVSLDPSIAANAGLFEDSVRVPSYEPAAIKALVARIDHDLAAMRALPWRDYPIDEQIDYSWLWANAQTARRALVDERLFEHRSAQWLEPLSNTLIAFFSYAPDRPDLVRRTLALVPKMLAEARTVTKRATRRDVATSRKITDALIAMAKQAPSSEGRAAATALASYAAYLEKLEPTVEYEVVGAENYSWRYRHAALLPWTPDELLRNAQDELSKVDAQLADLTPRLEPARPPSDAQRERAHALTRGSLLGLYDGIEVSLRAASVKGGWVTVPDWVGPIRARETPDAAVPLTGDGGSMNPPPTYVSSNVGYWNVEHFQAGWSEAERLKKVTTAEAFATNGLGPYAAHEGFPGHHLQLSIARVNKDPLRSVLADPVLVEGWAVYVEKVLLDHGGLGDSPSSRAAVLRSLRHRIVRVLYDVNVERGTWDLQRAADFKDSAAAGRGAVDEDLLRAIQWPTQLICYDAGRLQLIALREEVKRRLGAHFDERAFHDAVLAEGSIPVALIRAKMLGEALLSPAE